MNPWYRALLLLVCTFLVVDAVADLKAQRYGWALSSAVIVTAICLVLLVE